MDSIRNKTLVKDILEAEDKVTDFIDQFCEEAAFTESEMVRLSTAWENGRKGVKSERGDDEGGEYREDVSLLRDTWRE